MICSFNKVYKPLFFNNARYYDLFGGRGRGGSHQGTLLFLHLITQPVYFRGCFLRQVLGDVRGSLFQDFKDRIDEVEMENGSIKLEDFDINDSLMTIKHKKTGNLIISKGVTKSGGRTAKLKSLAGVTHVLIEEADEMGLIDFDQLDLSLRTTKVPGGVKVIRIFNPPGKEHWIWKDYNLTEAPDEYFKGHAPLNKDEYFIATPKQARVILRNKISKPLVVAIFSTYHDNRKFLDRGFIEKLESYLETDPDYYYTIVLGLISEGSRGRIFSRWKFITNDFFNNIDAKSLFCLDFGLASPAGLVELKFVRNNLYIRELNYLPLTNLEIAFKMCLLGITQKHSIVADSAEPHSIAKLRRGFSMDELAGLKDRIMDNGIVKPQFLPMLNGFNIYPATKGPGSVKAGISQLKQYIVHVTEDSKNLKTEYINYKWALDKNKFPTDEPIDQFNHLIDPTRYGVKDKERYY